MTTSFATAPSGYSIWRTENLKNISSYFHCYNIGEVFIVCWIDSYVESFSILSM